ncbi:MAG: hypothetical protein ACI8WB_002893 [Phenylobacterium sp.]|jgi:hypothetical protein
MARFTQAKFKKAWLDGILVVFTLFTLFTAKAKADDDWGDDWTQIPTVSSPWQTTGFVEAAFGHFLPANIVESSSSLKELRGRLAVDYSHDDFEFSAKGDWLFDAVLSRSLWQTRALNIAFSPVDNVDIKIGRQVLSWGTGDYLFLNDMFAKDWQSFFSGRDDEYLKAPSDSVRLTYYLNDFTVDLAWTPQFKPDYYLTGERFSFYSPQAQQLVAPGDDFKVEQTDNSQWSMRLATSVEGVEYALYGYHGFWNTPEGERENEGRRYFPELNSWGASVRLPWASGLFNAEVAAYNSTEDSQGHNPFIANSQQRLLLGYEREVVKNFTVGGQYYVEKNKNHEAPLASLQSDFQRPIQSEYRQLLTLRLRYAAMGQKLVYSLFAFYSPTDHDSYLRPSMSYRKDDHRVLSAGANLFGGNDQYHFFSQHQDNSNIWIRLRYLY